MTEVNPILKARVKANTEQMPVDAAVANATGAEAPPAVERRKRIPMSVARRTMEVDALPGFHLHWFSEKNVARALDAGYEFVERDEVHVNQKSPGASRDLSGSTDLGSKVSIIGSIGEGKESSERAYLMKIRNEYRKEDVEAMAEIASRPLKSIFVDEDIAGPDGTIEKRGELVYVKTALLNRPTRKAKLQAR